MVKTILITGATDGIGKLTAKKLAKQGHILYLHGRNPKKLTETITELQSISDDENKVQGIVADFSTLTGVKQMAATLNQEVSQIDVLINNAGIFNSPLSKSKKELDIRFTVNYLAPYLLTKELMPLLEKGARSRIINLSSAAQSPVSLEALSGNQHLSAQEAYAQSKLALTMWSFNLAKNVDNVSVIAVNPGSLLNTKMANEAYGQHWSSADKGANILYDLAISEEYNDVTGKYFDNDKGTEKGIFAPAHPEAYNQEKIDLLISQTELLIQ